MYLSKIDIVGFKSFANKIHVKFDTGMTAIVGPNGCGKTNVVDAIRWSLGEQKPSMLRSDKMEDVIFNGTKSRKPLGMAEVTLTIENTKGVLPVEFREVTITRRVFRSGESEYYLNGALCRLRDIREMFMDTGMGSDAYSVIELKMVETILSDNADERRHMFEEAAGIVKYKQRKKETLRRLSNVQLDLSRVNDIYKEVEKTVNSLDRQAKKAEQYNIITKELRDLEITLLEREFLQINQEIIPLENLLNDVNNEKEKISTELNKGESELDVLKVGLDEMEQKLQESHTELNALQEKISLSKQNRISMTERKAFLIESIKKYEKEIISLSKQKIEVEKKINDLNIKLEVANKEFEFAKIDYETKNSELIKLELILENKKNEVENLQTKSIKLLHDLTDTRNEVEKNKGRVENIKGRVDNAEDENKRFTNEIIEIEQEIISLTNQDKELRHLHAEKEVSLSEHENEKVLLQKEIENIKHELLEIKSLIDRKNNRKDFLQSLIDSNDGISEGARYLVRESEMRSKIFNSVSEIISVDEDYKIAIETCLSEYATFLIVDNVSDAHRGIEILKKTNKGRATFICLDRIPKENIKTEKISGAQQLINFLNFDNKYSNLINFLFQNIYLVDSLSEAVAITKENDKINCVTINGEFVSNSGIVKGGKDEFSDSNLIGKKNQIQNLEKEIAQLENDSEKLIDKKETVENKISKINIADLKIDARTIEQKMTSVEMRIAQIEYEKRKMLDTINRNKIENEKFSIELIELEKIISELSPKITILENEKSETEQISGAAKNELSNIELDVNNKRKIVNDSNVLLVQKENIKSNLLREIEFLNTSIINISESSIQRKSDIEKYQLEISEIDLKLIEANSELDLFSSDLKLKDENRKFVEKDVSSKRKTVHSMELKIKDERRLHDSTISKLHEAEIKLSKLKTRKDLIIQIAKEDFDLELKIKEFLDEKVFDFEQSRNLVHEKKEKLKQIGAVNFTAFEEHIAEKERLDFMTTQRNDLIDSEKTLLETINEINTTAEKKFLDTFKIIRENFISIFKELFDEGDECDLILEEGVDLLDAHIQIIAKPRGKRPTSIDLLSGGEKTLTAIALLFAIYLVKPSPFCILDEVDAPLDDSNIDRFCRIIRKFSANTQFIIVTHNKRTMESTNAMYGVTMEEEGISKLVSVRFNETAA